MKRQGYTLVEILIATALAMTLMVIVIDVLLSGSKLFGRGVEAARGPEAAILLMDRLEEDIAQVMQTPGDPRPPMRVSPDGLRLTFYRASDQLSTPAVAVGEPVSWGLEKRSDGLFHPVRDRVPLKSIVLAGWDLKVLEPDVEQQRPGWYLSMRVRFPAQSRFGREYVSGRLIYLPQPSANFMSYPMFGSELVPGVTRMVPRPEDDGGFVGLGPPDAEGAGSIMKVRDEGGFE